MVLSVLNSDVKKFIKMTGGNNKKGTPQKKQHSVSSPSHPKQRVEVVYPSDSSSSGSSTTAKMYADEDSTTNNQHTQNTIEQRVNSGIQNCYPISSGADALATSLNLKQTEANNKSVTGKRERDFEEISLKEYLCNCYQSITGESVNEELSSEDIFELLLSTSNDQYSNDSEFKNRMAFLQRVFRE